MFRKKSFFSPPQAFILYLCSLQHLDNHMYMPTKTISASFMAFFSLASLVGIVKALSARHSKENLGYLYDYLSDDFSTFALRRKALWASILSRSHDDGHKIYRQGCESLAQSHYFYVYYARRMLLSCRSIKSDGIR